MITIEGSCVSLSGKRVYLPGITVSSPCPTCGKVVKKDLSESYLSEGNTTIGFYCWDNTEDSCETEWSFPCRLEIKLIPLEKE